MKQTLLGIVSFMCRTLSKFQVKHCLFRVRARAGSWFSSARRLILSFSTRPIPTTVAVFLGTSETQKCEHFCRFQLIIFRNENWWKFSHPRRHILNFSGSGGVNQRFTTMFHHFRRSFYFQWEYMKQTRKKGWGVEEEKEGE